jgi:Putative zinc-finger
MKCKDVKYYLGDYLNGKLIDEMRREIEVHLTLCHSCKKKSNELMANLKLSGIIRKKIHQGSFWEGVSDLNETDSGPKLPDILFSPYKRKEDPRYKIKLRKKILRSKWIAIGAPLASILLAILLSVLYFSKTSATFWQVESIKGSPIAGNIRLDGSGILRVGEWLKTDASSEALLRAGMIGAVDIKPNSEIRLIETNDKEYKLYLSIGKISAKTLSPPNMFKVETRVGEAIDLGCNYTISVDGDGSTEIQVTSGWAAFKSGKSESILPAGTVCEIRIKGGPGTPYSIKTTTEFKDALTSFDFENGGEPALEEILKDAGKLDAISLWYLIKNANVEEKELIYNKLEELVPPPGSITYNGIMNGNNEMLFKWGEKIGCGSRALWDSISE